MTEVILLNISIVMIISRQQFTEGCGCDPLGGIISLNDLKTKVSGHVLIN